MPLEHLLSVESKEHMLTLDRVFDKTVKTRDKHQQACEIANAVTKLMNGGGYAVARGFEIRVYVNDKSHVRTFQESLKNTVASDATTKKFKENILGVGDAKGWLGKVKPDHRQDWATTTSGAHREQPVVQPIRPQSNAESVRSSVGDDEEVVLLQVINGTLTREKFEMMCKTISTTSKTETALIFVANNRTAFAKAKKNTLQNITCRDSRGKPMVNIIPSSATNADGLEDMLDTQ